MRFTWRRGCPKDSRSGAEGNIDGALRSGFFVARGRAPNAVLLVLVVSLAGCQSHVTLNANYAALSPRTIDTRWPQNDTVVPLDQVAYGGFLQRGITGPRVFNVPLLFVRGLRDSLRNKRYLITENLSDAHKDADFRGPLLKSHPDLPFDAVLYSTFLSWSRSGGFPDRVDSKVRIELYKVRSGEKLYEIVYSIHMKDTGTDGKGNSRGRFLVDGLKRAAYAATADLPDATVHEK